MYFDNIVATANIYVINFRNSKNVRQVYLRNNNHLRDIYCWHLLYKGLHWLSYINRNTGFIKCLISKRRQHVDLHKVLHYSRLVQYKIHVVIDSHLSQFLERTKHTKCINSDLMILKYQFKKNIPNKNRFRTVYSINRLCISADLNANGSIFSSNQLLEVNCSVECTTLVITFNWCILILCALWNTLKYFEWFERKRSEQSDLLLW